LRDLTLTPPSTRVQPPSDSDRATISKTNPALFVFLLDQSASMAEPGADSPGQGRAEAVADIVNRMLLDMVIRCSRADGVLDYFQVAILGYGGRAGVVSPAWQGTLA